MCYHEHGQRRRPRVGVDRAAAKTLAAQINGQLEAGVHTFLNFDPISIPKLRERWLAHHEHVLRSSVHTINRFRTASDHLLRFLSGVRAVRLIRQLEPFSFAYFLSNLSYLQSMGLILLSSTKVGRTYTNRIQGVFPPDLLHQIIDTRSQ